MFFKHKHLLEDLRKNGRSARAEILSMKTLGEGSNIRAIWAPDEDLTSGWTDCRMKLRVIPDDRWEAPFEATVLTRIHTFKYKGDSVPVWYDPNDHSKVVVDYEADVERKIRVQQEMDKAQQDWDRTAHRYDQRPGLAWTPVGGVLLPLEAMTRSGKGRLTVTGQLSKVLDESAQAAVSYVRSHAAQLLPELDGDWFAKHDIQIVQPYGAVPAHTTPEEWASAGLAVAAALVSLLGGRIVRTDVAVTGKLTPAGELLPVGGFKEKALAAKRDYRQRVVAPAGNEHNAREVPERQRQGLEFVFVSNVDEALRAALAKHRVKGFEPPA